MKKVFLGGTCNGSSWREKLIPLLKIDYFNPLVDDWTLECQAEEIRQREECDYCLYTITPMMKGFYSIMEVVEDSIKRPDKTLLWLNSFDDGLTFDDKQRKSLIAVAEMVKRNGAKIFFCLKNVAEYLNS